MSSVVLPVAAVLAFVIGVTPARGDASADCRQDQDPDRSIRSCTEIIGQGREPKDRLANAYHFRGVAYRNKRHPDRALADLSEAIRLNPQYGRAYSNRGETYAYTGDYDRAIADYDQAIRLEPNHARNYNNRGFLFYQKRQYERAIADFDQAIRLEPQYATAHTNRANAQRDKAQRETAKASHDQAPSPDPKSATVTSNYGPLGPEGPQMRQQTWRLPGGDPRIDLHATVFQPAASGDRGARPLLVVNPGTPRNPEQIKLDPTPPFLGLIRWFVDRGYVVVVPLRRGYGGTGDIPVDGSGPCENPDVIRAGNNAADDVEAVIRFMTRQQQIPVSSVVVLGHSSGGWASIATAARNVPGVRAVINFAGIRGVNPKTQPFTNCAPDRVTAAAGHFGRTAKAPSLWIYTQNDTFVSPELATAMADSWRRAGGSIEFHLLPAFLNEGHNLFGLKQGIEIWGPIAEKFLNQHTDPIAVR